jgi:hypothetical protein
MINTELNFYDHQLLDRMVDAGMSLKYEGPEWSFLAINGRNNYAKLFKGGIKTHKEALDGSVKHSVWKSYKKT